MIDEVQAPFAFFLDKFHGEASSKRLTRLAPQSLNIKPCLAQPLNCYGLDQLLAELHVVHSHHFM